MFPEDAKYTIHIDTAFKKEQERRVADEQRRLRMMYPNEPGTVRTLMAQFIEKEIYKMDPNKPEPKPKGTGREVTPLVIKDLELRSKMGAEKYGETLRAFNGRNPLIDAYQEVLDLAQYLRQEIEEQAAKAARVDPFDVVDLQIEPVMAPCIVEKGAVRDAYLRPGRIIPVQGPPSPFLTFTPVKESESIAQEAHRLVLGDRGEAYGHPIFDMTRSADLLTSLLRNKLRVGVRLEAEDIGQAMICVKQSRQRNRAKRDNLVDTAGYALTLQMIADWRKENPGVDPRDVFPSA
jgi:hypothetical protein